MKKRLAVLLCFAVYTIAMAEEPPAVTLQVKRISSMTDVQKNWESSWGSYDRNYSRTVDIDISLLNMRSTDASFSLDVLFVAKPLSGSKRWVFDRSTETVKLGPAKAFHTVKKSKTMEASVQNYAFSGFKHESGGRIEGYIVRVLWDSRIVKVVASSYDLQKIGNDQEASDALMKAEPKK